MLYFCPKCREKSVARPVKRQVEFCINKGCGYVQSLKHEEVRDGTRESICGNDIGDGHR